MPNLSLRPRHARKMPGTWKGLHEYLSSGFMNSWISKQNTQLSGTTAFGFLKLASNNVLSFSFLFILQKHSTAELPPQPCFLEICLTMYPSLASKWKSSCLNFPECWYIPPHFIPYFDHILATYMSLLLQLPTAPKLKPSNDCVLSFLEQKATS